MSITATIKLEETRLFWSQTTRCQTELTNNENETLPFINPRNLKGAPTISVKNVETEEMTFYAQILTLDAERPPISLKSGETLQETFFLSRLFQFPSCGIFDLQAHYEWNGGSIESEPVRVEVLPGNPEILSTATTRGSGAGDVYCAWVNKEGNEPKLWLSLVNTFWEPRFISSQNAGNISGVTTPYLSIPANTIPINQYIAWITGNKLNYVIHQEGQFQSNVFELDSDNYEIIPPLLEDPFVEGVRQFAEVLLIKKDPDGWQLRTVLLNESPSLSSDPGKFQNVVPQWIQTVYRSTGDRFTFVLLPQSREGKPYVKLAMFLWKARHAPAKPVFLKNWDGNMIAADVLLASDDRIVGAILVEQKNGDEIEFVIQKWQLDKNSELSLSSSPLLDWNEKWEIEHSILRVNGQGDTFLLLKGGPEGKWYWADRTGEVTFLAELSPHINLPADIIFVDQIYPALLYTDKTCGLKLHYLGPKRVYRPPTGAF